MKIMDLGLSSVRVRVKVRVSVRFMVSFRHFKVHKIRTSAHPWPLPCSFHLPECAPMVCIRWVQIPHGTGKF